MNVDPADTAAVQAPATNEGDGFAVGHGAGLMHPLVILQELLSTATVAHKKLAVDQFVSGHILAIHKFVQFGQEWRLPGKRPNPNRGVYQDHQATRRLAAGFSRRLDTSCASGSVPR